MHIKMTNGLAMEDLQRDQEGYMSSLELSRFIVLPMIIKHVFNLNL